jgi:hypothetical protein
MADNFNLRSFLSENKLTKNAKLISEGVEFNGKPVDINSIEIDGIDMNDYPDFVDAYITYAEYEDGTPLTDEELHDFEAESYGLVGELIHDKQLYLQEKKEEMEEEVAVSEDLDTYNTPPWDRPKYKGWDWESDADYEDDEEPFHPYQYLKQEYGSKAKAIENNIYDASDEEDKDYWEEFMALESPKEADEFLERFANVDESINNEEVEEAYQPKSKLEQVIQQAWAEKDLETAKQLVIDLIEPSGVKSKDIILQTIKGINNKPKLDQYLANSLLKFEKLGLNETATKMTNREEYLTRLVENALGIEKEGYHDSDDLEDNVSNDAAYEKAFDTMDESEMVEKEPLPKYESIEKLMQEIEHGTNKAMYEYKMNRMKEIAEMLETKVTSLEEGEHADHIDQKAVKQMRKDIVALRKGEEKLRKEFDKKFNKKGKAAEPKAEAEKPALQEGTFDLRKFLIENRK